MQKKSEKGRLMAMRSREMTVRRMAQSAGSSIMFPVISVTIYTVIEIYMIYWINEYSCIYSKTFLIRADSES